MMTTLLLVRHGQSEANLKDVFIGHTDANMTELGVQQARKTAQYIAQHYNVDYVYTSDLKRAYFTGLEIAQECGLNIILDKRLREIDAGEWENISFQELDRKYSVDYKRWKTDIGLSCCTGGESVKALSERILGGLIDIAKRHDGKNVVIATHATAIRAMQCVFAGKPLSEMKDIPWSSNASITEVVYENGSWHTVSAGFDEHLNDLRTELPQNV